MTRWLVAASWIAVIGCAGGPKAGTMPAPVSLALLDQAKTRAPATTEQSLAEGRQLFIERCAACHVLPDRRAYSDERWPKILDEMAPKAKLDARQRELVLQFILAERNLPPH